MGNKIVKKAVSGIITSGILREITKIEVIEVTTKNYKMGMKFKKINPDDPEFLFAIKKRKYIK